MIRTMKWPQQGRNQKYHLLEKARNDKGNWWTLLLFIHDLCNLTHVDKFCFDLHNGFWFIIFPCSWPDLTYVYLPWQLPATMINCHYIVSCWGEARNNHQYYRLDTGNKSAGVGGIWLSVMKAAMWRLFSCSSRYEVDTGYRASNNPFPLIHLRYLIMTVDHDSRLCTSSYASPM